MKEADGWDSMISEELSFKWVKNLWTLKLKGITFVGAKMPEDALDEKMRMLVFVDVAKMLIVAEIWVGFKLKCDGWSCA